MPTHKHDPDLLKAIGQRLQNARTAAGRTQADLAESVGIEPVTLSRYETGTRGPSITTLSLMAAALDVKLADLVDVDYDLPEPAHAPEVQQAIRLMEAATPEQRERAVRVLRELLA